MSSLCAIPLAASLFSACAAAAPDAVGYVEGEYVLLAPIEMAQIVSVHSRRGQHVEKGQVLARLESRDAEIEVARTEAALAQAKAQLADLKKGKRPAEIAVLEASLRSAEAEAREAERSLERIRDLHERGVATQADFDKARTAAELAEAKTGQAKANLEVAKLPARAEAIEAAASQVEQAKSALAQARWRLSRRVIEAPSEGRISDVIRASGDNAGPSAPVFSMLPDGAAKLKFYVPEPDFSKLVVDDLVSVTCDGCPGGLRARVSYIAPDPEFTPPVIYSLETRQKLVYLVEAKPVGDTAYLEPGQIVDVRLEDADR